MHSGKLLHSHGFLWKIYQKYHAKWLSDLPTYKTSVYHLSYPDFPSSRHFPSLPFYYWRPWKNLELLVRKISVWNSGFYLKVNEESSAASITEIILTVTINLISIFESDLSDQKFSHCIKSEVFRQHFFT